MEETKWSAFNWPVDMIIYIVSIVLICSKRLYLFFFQVNTRLLISRFSLGAGPRRKPRAGSCGKTPFFLVLFSLSLSYLIFSFFFQFIFWVFFRSVQMLRLSIYLCCNASVHPPPCCAALQFSWIGWALNLH